MSTPVSMKMKMRAVYSYFGESKTGSVHIHVSGRVKLRVYVFLFQGEWKWEGISVYSCFREGEIEVVWGEKWKLVYFCFRESKNEDMSIPASGSMKNESVYFCFREGEKWGRVYFLFLGRAGGRRDCSCFMEVKNERLSIPVSLN